MSDMIQYVNNIPTIVFRKVIMALYIAVCDDNAADRKQIERLLDRENSIQKSRGNPLYFDSFGSKDSLMKTPNRYNLFLITASADSELNGTAIANEIKQAGIDALIVMMCSPGRSEDLTGSGFITKDKPITASDISELVSLAGTCANNKTPLIEIRCNGTTVFAKPEEFICAIAAKNGFGLEVHLTDGRKYVGTDTLDQFSLWMDSFKEIVRCGNSYVNQNHIRSLSAFHLTLSNGIRLPVNPFERSKIHSVR